VKQLLNEARSEIISLRRRNEILEAQVGVIEVFAAALGLRANHSGTSPDVAWALQKAINDLDKKS
jgi:hypothetical protein